MNVFHNGGFGDLLYGLIAVGEIGGASIYLPHAMGANGNPPPLHVEFFEPMRWLLHRQTRVDQVYECERFGDVPEPRLDLGAFTRNGNLAQGQCEAAGVKFPGFDPWLEADPWNPFDEPFSIVNRTRRYTTAHKWRDTVDGIGHRTVFVGFDDEHSEFESAYGPIERFKVADLLEFANLIAGSEALYCNPTASLVIAQGLGHRYFLEEGVGHVRTYRDNETVLSR